MDTTHEIRLEPLLNPAVSLYINASIAIHNNRVWCVYRSEQYNLYSSVTYLTELDKDFKPISHKILVPENENPAFEDVRIFSYQGELLAIYTYLAGSPDTGWLFNNAAAYGVIDTDNGIITRQQSFRCYSKRVFEKNWTPACWNGELYFITDFAPKIRILKAVGVPGNFVLHEYYNAYQPTQNWDLGELRGGTPFIACPVQKSNWLYGFIHSFFVKEINHRPTRIYHYTIARINFLDFRFEYYPKPIGYWENETSKEYDRLVALGANCYYNMQCVFPMGIMDDGNGVWMSYGKDDCVSRLKFFSWEYLISLFA